MAKEPTSFPIGKGGEFKVEKNARRVSFIGNRPSLLGVSELALVIESVLRAGAYFSVGATSDGGALLIRVLDGDNKLSTYCHTDEQLLAALEALAVRYSDTYPNG